MTNLSKRNRANKRRGASWEVAIRNFLHGLGLKAERVARKGANDIGDVAVELDDGHVFVIEAKDTVRPELAQWIREAQIEADNYARHRHLSPDFVHPVVVYKRRQHGVEQAYVVMTLGDWADAL